MKDHSSRVIWRILLVVLLVPCIIPGRALSASARRQTAADVSAVVKTIANDLIDSQADRLGRPPRLEVNLDQSRIVFSRGWLNPSFGFDAGNPYTFVYSEQIRLDWLRRTITGSLPKTTGKQPPKAGKKLEPSTETSTLQITRELDEIERLLFLTIEDIVRHTPTESGAATATPALEDTLMQRKGQFLKQWARVEHALKEYARLNGFSLEISPDPIGIVQPFSVRVVTEPGGGTVKYIPALMFRHYSALKGPSIPVEQWRDELKTIAQDRVSLIGEYYFYVAWPDGRNSLKGPVSIVNQDPVVLRPDPKE